MDYETLAENLAAISGDVGNPVSILANASALLWDAMPDLNWCGFYLTVNSRLELGPFQGKIACTAIDYGKGVCGTAALRNETVLVRDVHTFDGHIACDSASNSEIVVPLRKNGGVIGVLDIDSPLFARFDEADRAGLERFAGTLEKYL